MNARKQIIDTIQGFEFEHYGVNDESERDWQPILADRIMSALHIAPDVRHGEGSLPHGYDGDCDDDCDNRQCPAGHNHDRCVASCVSGETRG